MSEWKEYKLTDFADINMGQLKKENGSSKMKREKRPTPHIQTVVGN
jgi:hypothetical protein